MKYIDLFKNKKFFGKEEGFTIVEYAIAGSLVGAVAIVALGNLGDAVNTVINWLMH
jgi:Flp pilus assembly pilin Flp